MNLELTFELTNAFEKTLGDLSHRVPVPDRHHVTIDRRYGKISNCRADSLSESLALFLQARNRPVGKTRVESRFLAMKIQKFINTEKFRLVFYLTGFNPMSWTLVHLYPLFYYSKNNLATHFLPF